MKDNDIFHGDNKKLAESIEALLALDAKGALVPHGIGEHARTLLSTAIQRLATAEAGIKWEADRNALLLAELESHESLCGDTPRCPGCGYTEQDCREQMDHHLCGLPEPAPVKPRPIRFADLPMPSPLPVPAPAYWVDEFGCTIKADHKARNEALGGAPAKVVERYTAPLYFGPPDVELMRDALDHIAKTCHQSRQSTRRIRWIEARANGALEGKTYDAKLLDLPVEVDREIDRFKRRDRRQLTRIRELEALLREVAALDPNGEFLGWQLDGKIDAALNPIITQVED